jgi:hypothetical protein
MLVHAVTTTVSVAVITVASKRGGYIDLFEETARRRGIKPIILGLDSPYRANTCKLPIMLHWAMDHGKKYSHVVFSDAYDSFFLSGIDKIMARYFEFEHPFVCTGESNCWPDPTIKRQYPKSTNTDLHYLNSGGFVAEIGAFIDVLKASIPLISASAGSKKDRSDQRIWQTLHVQDRSRFSLDYYCKIFLPMPSFAEDIDLVEEDGKKTIMNKLDGSSPCIVHCAGQTRIDEIAQFLAGELP